MCACLVASSSETLRGNRKVKRPSSCRERRRAAVRFRKTQDDRTASSLGQILDALSPSETLSVGARFSYFSQLSNIAEDCITTAAPRPFKGGQHANGRHAATALEPRSEEDDNKILQSFLDSAWFAVLMRHPTEVQRRVSSTAS